MGTDSTPTRYIAGWNLAGYLPETEPEIFDTLGEAEQYLREQADLWWDQDSDLPDEEQTPPPAIARGDVWVDGWYGDLHLWAEPYTGE